MRINIARQWDGADLPWQFVCSPNSQYSEVAGESIIPSHVGLGQLSFGSPTRKWCRDWKRAAIPGLFMESGRNRRYMAIDRWSRGHLQWGPLLVRLKQMAFSSNSILSGVCKTAESSWTVFNIASASRGFRTIYSGPCRRLRLWIIKSLLASMGC